MDEAPTAGSAMHLARGFRWPLILLVALPALVVAVAFFHVYTVATGVIDLLNYYSTAWHILEGTSWREVLQATLVWAPVHPLLLALVMQVAGPEWTYFIPPVMTVLLCVGLGCFSRTLMRDDRAGLFTALAVPWLLMFGYPHFSYFLLYPYREATSLALIAWSMAMVALAVYAQPGWRRYGLWLLSSCGFMVAAATREPSICAFAGALCLILFHRVDEWKSRSMAMMFMLLPVLLAVLVLVGASYSMGIVGSRQFAGWRTLTAGRDGAAWTALYLQYVVGCGRTLGLGAGALAVLGGVTMGRKFPAALVMLAVSVATTLALYATFEFYPRYALSVLVFFVPLIGIGLAVVARFMDRLFAGVTRWAVPLPTLLLVAGLTGLGVYRAAQLTPWGGVTMSEIDTFRDRLRPHLKPDEPVFVDMRSRLLREVMLVYFGRSVSTDTDYWAPDETEGLFIRPENDAALTRAVVAVPPVSMEDDLASYADLVPVLENDGGVGVLALGDAAFSVQKVRPWRILSSRESLERAGVSQGLIWLNFQMSDPQAECRVRLVSVSGEDLYKWPPFQGDGLVPLALPEPLLAGLPAVLEVASDRPGPSRLVVPSARRGNGNAFGLGKGRLPIALNWVKAPTAVDPLAKWGAVFGDGAAFRIPYPIGMTDGVYDVTLEIEPRYRRDETVVFTYAASGGGPLLVATNRLNRPRIKHTVSMTAPFDESYGSLGVSVTVPESFANHFRLVSMAFSARQF